ncbi:MAG TPA: hypothetical protein VGQ37_04600 [Vicinamibacterales bacterium]|nr:hypothetical protein [Vicinamibacterales bacterium]
MNRLLALSILLALPSAGAAQAPLQTLEGMWSNPPTTIIGSACAFYCTDVLIDRLNALVDDPANDRTPLGQLRADASARERAFIESRLTAAAKETYPLDPADDPGLLRCEPWGLARQMFAPHQIEIRGRGRDEIELHYGEWDARRIVHMDGRPRPAGPASLLGYSVGRWEGATLVVETSGVAANLTGWRSKHSEQVRVTERFTRAADGKTLNLVATFADPWSLRAPLVLKKIWAWSPTSQIAPYDACEPPASVKRGVAP